MSSEVLIWVCERCGKEIQVEPLETNQYRGITCEDCGSFFPVLNSELKHRESNRPIDLRQWDCHPERSGCFAKRSSHEVEGPLTRVE
jgi:DNA-directed RNA polymerase subunit RPC12/RpoP